MSLFGSIANSYVAASGSDPRQGVPTRFYFATAGTASASPTPDSGWEVIDAGGGYPSRPLMLASELSGGTAGNTASFTSSTGSVTDVIYRQHVTTATVPSSRTITGTMKVLMRCRQSSGTSGQYLQAIARIISGDGTTVRGVLYAGQTATSTDLTSGSNAEQWTTGTSATRIMTVTLTPVAAQAGDRLVIEIGARSCVPTSTTGQFNLSDSASSSDAPFTSGQTTTSTRTWAEINYDIFGT